MTDDGHRGHGGAYRGFLFTDVRGFSSYAERHGNAATAVMIRRFLDLARSAIARHDGAEIKTEGDNVFAVFKSASSAVMCGLEIVEAAAERPDGDPGPPLKVGVGVHAGEAVQTAEGYVGRAVIIAARLCAVAGPGEVLVSSTVKGIAQASIPVGFVPRGRRRLKGIQDPILTYAVSRDPNARARRELPRPRLLAAAGAAALVAVVSLAALAAALGPSNPSASPSPEAAPTGQPVAMGPLSIGTYASTEFQPAVRFDVGDTGWAANRDAPGLLGLLREGPPAGASLYFARVSEVVSSPCVDGGEGATGPEFIDALEHLRLLDHLEVTNQVPTEVGGYVGRQVDVTVNEAALAACGGPVGGDVSLFVAGDEVWSATPGERFRLISIPVETEPVTIVMSLEWTQMHSVQELETFFTVGQRILDSVEFSSSTDG